MAYTKTPSVSTQHTERIPVKNSMLPGTLTTPGTNYINCHPVHYTQWGTDPAHVVEKRPYLVLDSSLSAVCLTSTSTLPRGMYYSIQSGMITCQAGSFYTQAGGTQASTYATGYVGFTEYVIGTTSYVVALESHGTTAWMWYLNTATSAWTGVNLGVPAYGNPVFIDGYIFFNSYPTNNSAVPTQRIYNSTIGAPMTFATGTDYVDAESSGDRVIAITKHHNHLVVFGDRSIEFLYDNANQYGSPLTRNQSYTVSMGTLPLLSLQTAPLVCNVADVVYFIGRDSTGSCGIYQIENYQLKEVSSPFIKRWLNENNPLSDTLITLVPANSRGREVILFTLADATGTIKTWVYVIEENVWTEWRFLETTANTTIRPMFSAPSAGQTSDLITKRITSGTTYYELYKLDNSAQTASHTTEEITARIITDLVDFGVNNGKHFRYVDVLGDYGSNTVRLEYTKNTDYTTFTDMGTLDYTTRNRADPLRYRNLGRATEMAFRVSITGKQNMLFQGLEATYNQGSF